MTKHVFISTPRQKLFLLSNGEISKSYPISTAKNGLGEQEGSECTPRGWHKITDKIGDNEPVNRIFKARVITDQIFDAAVHPIESDWVLTRIMRLSGLEKGFNLGNDSQGNSCDSFSRYIYIHGTPEGNPLGQPLSHGCIRMHNQDVIELFDQVGLKTTVFIA